MSPRNAGWVIVRALLVVAVHFGLQQVSLSFVVNPGHISILWLPEGFLIAVLSQIPYRQWLPILVLTLPTIVWGDLSAGKLAGVGLGLAFANLLEASLGAAILKRAAGTSDLLGMARMVGALFGAGAIPSIVGGIIGAAVMTTWGGADSFLRVWLTWTSATFVGILMTLPISLALMNLRGKSHPSQWAQSFEFVAMIGISLGVAYSAFAGGQTPDGPFGPGIYATFPIFIWGAHRFGIVGAAVSFMIVGLVASACTSAGLSPFSMYGIDAGQQVALLQVYMMTAGISALLLAAASAQRAETMSKLVQEENRYRSLVENASDGIFVTDGKGNCVDVNQAGCDLLGYTRPELVGMNLEAVLEPSDRSQVQARLAAIRKGSRFVEERRLVRKDSETVLVEISAKGLADGRIIGICRDLSERAAHESIVRALVGGTAAATGEMFFRLAAENLARALNARCAVIAELTSHSPPSYVILAAVDGGNRVARSSHELQNSAASKVIELGRYVCGEAAQSQFPNDPLVTEVGAESVMGVALNDASGTPVGFTMVLHGHRIESFEPDLSVLAILGSRAGAEIERTRGERALRQSESRQRALLEAFPDTLFVLTLDGVYIDYHTLEMDRLRYAPSEFLGKSYRDVMPPSLVVHYDRAFEAMRRGKKPRVFEYLSDLNDEDRHYEVRHVSVGDGLVLAILRDITERKNFDAEIKNLNENLERLVSERTAQLEGANKELESFAYSVSHDLRAPLRAISSNAEFLREDLGSKATEEEIASLDRIASRAEEMSRLIDGLLKLSRIMRAEIQHVTVDLSGIAASIADSIERGLDGRNVKFEIEPNLMANGDPALIHALLQNLFDNAVKFTSQVDRARIEFGATQKDGQTVYFVRDNGAGFDPKFSDKLFRPFERLHAESEFAGTGIGLATVQRIVARHGGSIWAESRPAEGATFSFTLALERIPLPQ